MDIIEIIDIVGVSDDYINIIADRIEQLASYLKIDIPKIIISDEIDALGMFTSDYVMYIKPNLEQDLLFRVVDHEMAHAAHVYTNINCNTNTCEVFASMFEEFINRMGNMGINVLA